MTTRISVARSNSGFAMRAAAIALVTALSCSAPASGPAASTDVAAGEQKTAEPKLATKIVVAFAQEQAHLDRQILGPAGAPDTIYNVTDPLMRMSPDGTLMPGVVESWSGTQAGSEAVLTLKLRQDVVFSDGVPLDAAGFKVSMDRIMTKDSRVGATWFHAVITDVQVVDKWTVNIVHKPDATLTRNLAMQVELYSPEAIRLNPDALKTSPVGSGPYKVEQFEAGRLIRLVARDDYWGEKVYGRASIREIELRSISEAGVRLAQLLSGEAQIAQQVSPDDFAQLPSNQQLTLDGPELYFLRFGFSDPLTSDLRVRQAVSMAIDRDALGAIFNGFGEPASQFWPSTAAGWAQRPIPKVDLEAAKALIAAAGATGKEILIVYSGGYKERIGDVAQAIAPMIEATGLRVQLREIARADFTNLLRDKTVSQPIAVFSNGFESLDALAGMSRFECKGAFTTYCTEEIDRLIQSARDTPDEGARTKVLQQLMDVLDRDAVHVPLFNPPALWGISPKLDYTPLPFPALNFAAMKLLE